MSSSLHHLFEGHFGRPPARVEPVLGDGSPRARVRLTGADGRSAIGVPPGRREEDCAFLAFTRALHDAGLPVPALLAVDETSGAYLVEDAGRRSLHGALEAARRATGQAFPAVLLPAFREAAAWLPRFQVEGGRAVDFSSAWPRAAFDRRAMAWDLAWFKDCFLRLAGVAFDEDRLEDDFLRLLGCLEEDAEAHFLYRDFQARNVMQAPQGLRFLDYQGGRRGPLPYDVASLLYSGSTDLPDAVREDLLAAYLTALADHVRVDEARFRARLPAFAVLRILQALGAYGYRGLYLRRPGFADRIGTAARNLARLLGDRSALPDLPAVRLAAETVLARRDLVATPAAPPPGLVVRVGSFAYAHGIPRDPGGHGGGYVFDCRALPNPGREARFADRTGLDADVGAYLAASPEAQAFLEHAEALVGSQVEVYLARGFSGLDVRFGCTGGRHRSVWCAERLAERLSARFTGAGVVLLVEHAEADRWGEGARSDGDG